MILKDKQAANMLLGKVLEGGWEVIKKKEMGEHGSGGVYSATYEVLNGDRKGFLKAFDYSAANRIGQNSADQMKDILNAFAFEKEILEKCTGTHCKNVIKILDSGSTEVEEADKYPRVEYLILEYAAEGDIRNLLQENKINLEWKMRSLHQMAKGLNELHNISVAHQDIKPSNIVSMGDGITKLTDLGSAITINSSDSVLPPHLKKDFSGTWEYAPPELLYGEINSDPIIRRIGCDLYLLGSMIAFYFTNMSMTSLIKANLSDGLCWTENSNRGNYSSIRSYIIRAYEFALEDIGNKIEQDYLRKEIISAVRFLCNPIPEERGHIKNIKEKGRNHNLERFITLFDLLARRIKLKKV